MMDMPDTTEKKNNRVKGYAIWIGMIIASGLCTGSGIWLNASSTN